MFAASCRARLIAGVWICIGVGSGSAAASGDSPLTLPQAKAAFDVLAKERKQHNDLPRLADPEAAAVLRRIWTAATAPAALEGTIAEIMSISEVSTTEFQLFETYLYVRPPSSREIDFDEIAARFGPEMSHTLAASIAAAARLSAVFDRYRTVHPDPDPAHHAAMVRLLRQPSLSLVIYGARFMTAKTARPEDVARVAAAFGADGPTLASIVSKDKRGMVAASFRQQAAKLDGTPRQDIERAADAFSNAPCGPSCQIPP